MKQVLILVTLFTLSFAAFSQETKKPVKKSRKEAKRDKINAQIKAEEEGVIAYKKHYAFGVKLISDGYGISFEKGYSKSVKKATLFQLEIAERKHQKEIKQTSDILGASPFIYGKVNFFYPVKLGVQKQFLLGNKSNKNGVSVTANIGGGLSLGLLRPYEVEVNKAGKSTYIRYESADSTLFRNPQGIKRGPGMGTGWNHLKFTPGLYVKPGLRFDYGRYNDLVSAIEVGLAAEFYTKKILQMFDNKQKQLFFSAYFTILFGKRK
jgi:hypothetical protein